MSYIEHNGINLIGDDLIIRDLYLATFYDDKNPRLGPPTGDLYADRPWTKYYLNMGPKVDFNVYKSLYHNWCVSSFGRQNEVVLYFNDGKKYTNGDLKQMAVNTAAGLQTLVDKPRIAMLVNNSVEEPISLLATSICNGIIHPVDITKTPFDMKKSIDDFGPNIIVIDEMMMPLLPLINEKGSYVIVANSNKEFDNINVFSMNEIMERGKVNGLKKVNAFNPYDPFLVITSSGTTGRPKPIVHSSYSVNQAALKVLFTDYSLNRENVMIKAIPAHIGLGIITTLYTCLISGTRLAFVAGNGPEDSVRVCLDFVKKYPEFRKNNNLDDNAKLLMFAAPMFYRAMASQINSFDDLSYMGAMLAAGSKMTKKELDEINMILAKKGVNVPVCIGYGSNENAGAVTLNSNSYNENGSAGFPIIGTDVLVVDDNNNPIINKEGRVIVKGSSQFLYYLGMDEATAKTKININGETWVEMNDIGIMNDKGFLYIVGRLSRVITKNDCKISIDTVEGKIINHPLINECGIVALENNSNDVSYAFVTTNDVCDYNVIVNEINSLLSELERPDYVVVLDEMPYLTSGKIDFVKLKQAAEFDYENVKKGMLTKSLRA